MKYLPILAVLLVIAGCRSEQDATVIDAGGDRTITSIDQIDVQDYLRAADELVGSMFASDVFPPDARVVRIEVSRIRDESSALQTDTELLTNQVLAQLGRSRSPRVLARTPGAEDPLTDADLGGRSGAAASDYRLSGRITDQYARAGRQRQKTFVFEMTLTDDSGYGVWRDQRFITKAGTRNKAGL